MFEMIGGGERAGSGADTIKKGWADNKWPAPEIKEHFGQNDDRVELTRVNPSITIAELVSDWDSRRESGMTTSASALHTGLLSVRVQAHFLCTKDSSSASL